MTIFFVGDIHLGAESVSHSPKKYRDRLPRAIYNQADAVLRELSEDHPVVQLGDILDKPRNSDFVMYQASLLSKYILKILAGNHDLIPDYADMTTFGMLHSMDEHKWVSAKLGSSELVNLTLDKKKLSFLPYNFSQEAFEAAIDSANSVADVLCLHCNYDSPFAQSESSLNLSSEKAGELLNTYSNIIMGHEHSRRTDHGGRVVAAGCLYPVSFGELNDKYVWELKDNGALVPRKVWSASSSSKVNWKDALSIAGNIEWLTLVGEYNELESVELAKTLIELWDKYPSLVAVRNSLSSRAETKKVDTAELEKEDSLYDKIVHGLDGDLRTLFEEIYNETKKS